MNSKIFILAISVLLLQVEVSSQSTKAKQPPGIVRDSTKMPTGFSDVRIFKTASDNKEFIEFNFTTNERSEDPHTPYNLDSIRLFSDQKFITLTGIQKDTVCNDNSYMKFCNWKFTFPIDSIQHEFLEITELDKVIFWHKKIADKVYLNESDKKMFIDKIKKMPQ